MKKSKVYIGAFLIILGCLFLLEKVGLNINFGFYWPVVLLIPGIIFWVSFYQDKERKSSALLIPGTILIIYSLYFFFNQMYDYSYAGETSFIFTFGVALGFFAAYYFDKVKKKGYMITAWILSGAALINLLSTTTQWEWWPILIIGIGVYLLYKKDSKPLDSKESLNQESKK